MPIRGNYTLLRIRGIPISVDWSWFAVLFLIIWLLSESYRSMLGVSQDSVQPYALAVLSAFLFFASILLHELGHATVAQRNGIGITQITLWMFGGVAGLERDPRTAGQEFRIAAAGPAVTGVIAALALAHRVGRRRRLLLGRRPPRPERQRQRRRGGARLRRQHQRRDLRLQPRPRLPARRRPDPARNRLAADRGPGAGNGGRRPRRPGLRDAVHRDRDPDLPQRRLDRRRMARRRRLDARAVGPRRRPCAASSTAGSATSRSPT